MSLHLLWLWAWFFIGMAIFMLKRSYWGVYGPSPIGSSYGNYFQRCWVPLLVRFFWDSLIFWICFTPQLLAEGLSLLGWSSLSGGVAVITKFAPCAAGFGYLVDSILDTVAAIAEKHVPFLSGVLPPLPPPLPQKAIVQAAIVETKVTALETKTTTVPQEAKP
jgi:hypothetical protein